ncbi:MAG: hypothetical protein A3F90_13475 [Deltaproteobacteria bacterium RIFCSPLOWO2_12_FULL_60_19]|nr:MAG: hypothetical protein A3F90_13475 [Deltaproteobacteria bacterium RIFCSPLOWO2_12_FULL_60_19]
MKTVKVKIIGAGSIGNHLAQACRRMDWDVVVVDRDRAALDRMRNDLYPSRYGRWDARIELRVSAEEPRGGFDIICIGTPPDARMGLAVRALEERPKILQLEKPLCCPTLEGLDLFLSRYGAQRETIAVVGYDHAVSQAVSAVLERLDSGWAGEIATVDVEFREHWDGIFKAHPWLSGPRDSYLGFWSRGGGAGGEHSHALHLWQLFAGRAGLGRWRQVSAVMAMEQAGGADYDSLCAFSFVTDRGKVGRVVQDVVTSPPRKCARLQGSEGFIEWICNGHAKGDMVCYGRAGKDPVEEVYPKTRPDDFYREMDHLRELLEKRISPEQSPISLDSGVAVMQVLATAHRHRNGTAEIPSAPYTSR